MKKSTDRRKNIGVDVDGVIVETAAVYLRYIEKISDKKFSQSQVTSYLFQDCVDISEKEAIRAMEMMIDEDIWHEIPFYDGALEALKSIWKKHNLYIVTARPRKAEKATRKWIKNCGIPAEEVVFADMNSKLIHLKKKNIALDYFIEDRWEFAVEVSTCGTKVFLVDRPWNREQGVVNGIKRVSGLPEAAKLIS